MRRSEDWRGGDEHQQEELDACGVFEVVRDSARKCTYVVFMCF